MKCAQCSLAYHLVHDLANVQEFLALMRKIVIIGNVILVTIIIVIG